MSIVAALSRPGQSGFGYASTAEQVTAGLDLTGRTYLITGCNSGIGREATRVLGLRGAHLIALARTEDKAQQTLRELGITGTPVACDLSEPSSVHQAVRTVQASGRPLDGLIANAGIMALPRLEQKYGYELQFLTNHIGHFILVTGLLGNLADTGRVVILSSGAHNAAPQAGIEFDNLSGEKGYRPWAAYGQSKLANLLFAKHLSTRLPGVRQTANALHPGVIATNLARHMNPAVNVVLRLVGWIWLKSIEQGAATEVYVATHPSLDGVTGRYFSHCNFAEPSAHGKDAALAERLWIKSEAIVASLPR